MSKFDYTVEVCREKIKELDQKITVLYEKKRGKMGEDLEITEEDCRKRVSQLRKKIDELHLAIWTIERY